VSLAFWGLLVAFVAGVATNGTVATSCGVKWALAFFPIILGLAHIYWLSGLSRAYKIDKKEEGDLLEAMRIEASYQEDPDVTKWRSKIVNHRRLPGLLGLLMDWNLVSQVIMTLALTVLAASSLWLIRPKETPNQALQPTCATVPKNVPK
jgi:membrane protein implicated in regulation of membrane protease activity